MLTLRRILLATAAVLSLSAYAETVHNVFHLEVTGNNFLHNKVILDLNDHTTAGSIALDTVVPLSTTKGGLVNIDFTAAYTAGTDSVFIGAGPVYRVVTSHDAFYGIYGFINYNTVNSDIKTTTLNIGTEVSNGLFAANLNIYAPIDTDPQNYNGVAYQVMQGTSLSLERKFPLSYTTSVSLTSTISQFYDQNVATPISSSKIGLALVNIDGRTKRFEIEAELGNDSEARIGGRVSIALIRGSPYILSPLNRALLSAPTRLNTAVWGLYTGPPLA